MPLEIAIKDVAYQIQLHDNGDDEENDADSSGRSSSSRRVLSRLSSGLSSTVDQQSRFNPRVDATVLFLEMKNLKLHLDNFYFRIEKKENRTIFDPVFEGRGMVSLQNVSIRLRIECGKKTKKAEAAKSSSSSVPAVDALTAAAVTTTTTTTTVPVLQIRELDVQLEKVRLKVKDTGFGSDWLLNRAVHVFTQHITNVVEENLKEQIEEQTKKAIANINSYFAMNPKIFLNILGISMDDLDDENVLWV